METSELRQHYTHLYRSSGFSVMLAHDWMAKVCPTKPGQYPCNLDKDGNFWRSKGRFTIEDIYDMGVQTLKLNYIFWQMNPKNDGYEYIAEYDEVLKYIASRNGEINESMPTRLRKPASSRNSDPQ